MILAAGFGSRLRPLTDRVPKPLIEVAGKPLIAYPLALARAAGIRDVVVNLHHHGAAIRAALGDGAAYGMSIRYSDGDPILDTGGGILQARVARRGTLRRAQLGQHHRSRPACAGRLARPAGRAGDDGAPSRSRRGAVRSRRDRSRSACAACSAGPPLCPSRSPR
jgi:hypothetical protein